jgi:starvation-inducible DNA-binding protein
MKSSNKVEIGIKEKDRKQITDGLSHLLADSYILYLKTHNFHWNVEGPMFNTLHQMFMTQYTELWNALDLIAERIRSLGSYAPGSYKKFSQLSSIEESESHMPAKKMIKELLSGHEAVAKTARSLYPHAEAASDEVTLDLLTQRLEVHEKTAWMLRSLLKE